MFERFRQRSYKPERLDTGEYTPDEYARWQGEMQLLHRFWGELRALEHTLIRDIRNLRPGPLSILDIGAGTGDILKFVKATLPDHDLFLVAGDLALDALDAVAAESPSSGIHPVECSGLSLPFDDDSFDYTICTLLLHHLSDEDALALIREMRRVSRLRFYVVDLNRHPVGYYCFKLISPFLFQPFLREDGALSILRSFTPDEIMRLAGKAGISDVTVEHSRGNRLVLSGR